MMKERTEIKVDPNLASKVELMTLPGIGPSLADRILRDRPYLGLSDLLRVKGIKQSKLDQLAYYLSLDMDQEHISGPGLQAEAVDSPLPEVQISDPLDELPVENPAAAQGPEISNDEAVDQRQNDDKGGNDFNPQENFVKKAQVYSRNATIWLVAGSNLVTMIVAVVLTLLIMGSINGTLNIAQHPVVRQLVSQTAILEADVEDVRSGMEVLDERLAGVERLSGRLTTVEGQLGDLQAGFGEIDQAVTILDEQVVELSETTAELNERVGVFDQFLSKLRDFLDELLPTTVEELPES
jgi:hypothetical protein